MRYLIYFLVFVVHPHLGFVIKNTSTEHVRDTRQSIIDGKECCPCPKPDAITSETTILSKSVYPDQDLNAVTDSSLNKKYASKLFPFPTLGMSPKADDDCPCRNRASDTVESPNPAESQARASSDHERSAGPPENTKALLHPEVGFVSSVLETLRAASDDEYREALAREAAARTADSERETTSLGERLRSASTTPARKTVTITLKNAKPQKPIKVQSFKTANAKTAKPLETSSLKELLPNIEKDLSKPSDKNFVDQDLAPSDTSVVGTQTKNENIADEVKTVKTKKVEQPKQPRESLRSRMQKSHVKQKDPLKVAKSESDIEPTVRQLILHALNSKTDLSDVNLLNKQEGTDLLKSTFPTNTFQSSTPRSVFERTSLPDKIITTELNNSSSDSSRTNSKILTSMNMNKEHANAPIKPGNPKKSDQISSTLKRTRMPSLMKQRLHSLITRPSQKQNDGNTQAGMVSSLENNDQQTILPENITPLKEANLFDDSGRGQKESSLPILSLDNRRIDEEEATSDRKRLLSESSEKIHFTKPEDNRKILRSETIIPPKQPLLSEVAENKLNVNLKMEPSTSASTTPIIVNDQTQGSLDLKSKNDAAFNLKNSIVHIKDDLLASANDESLNKDNFKLSHAPTVPITDDLQPRIGSLITNNRQKPSLISQYLIKKKKAKSNADLTQEELKEDFEGLALTKTQDTSTNSDTTKDSSILSQPELLTKGSTKADVLHMGLATTTTISPVLNINLQNMDGTLLRPDKFKLQLLQSVTPKVKSEAKIGSSLNNDENHIAMISQASDSVPSKEITSLASTLLASPSETTNSGQIVIKSSTPKTISILNSYLSLRPNKANKDGGEKQRSEILKESNTVALESISGGSTPTSGMTVKNDLMIQQDSIVGSTAEITQMPKLEPSDTSIVAINKGVRPKHTNFWSSKADADLKSTIRDDSVADESAAVINKITPKSSFDKLLDVNSNVNGQDIKLKQRIQPKVRIESSTVTLQQSPYTSSNIKKTHISINPLTSSMLSRKKSNSKELQPENANLLNTAITVINTATPSTFSESEVNNLASNSEPTMARQRIAPKASAPLKALLKNKNILGKALINKTVDVASDDTLLKSSLVSDKNMLQVKPVDVYGTEDKGTNSDAKSITKASKLSDSIVAASSDHVGSKLLIDQSINKLLERIKLGTAPSASEKSFKLKEALNNNSVPDASLIVQPDNLIISTTQKPITESKSGSMEQKIAFNEPFFLRSSYSKPKIIQYNSPRASEVFDPLDAGPLKQKYGQSAINDVYKLVSQTLQSINERPNLDLNTYTKSVERLAELMNANKMALRQASPSILKNKSQLKSVLDIDQETQPTLQTKSLKKPLSLFSERMNSAASSKLTSARLLGNKISAKEGNRHVNDNLSSLNRKPVTFQSARDASLQQKERGPATASSRLENKVTAPLNLDTFQSTASTKNTLLSGNSKSISPQSQVTLGNSRNKFIQETTKHQLPKNILKQSLKTKFDGTVLQNKKSFGTMLEDKQKTLPISIFKKMQDNADIDNFDKSKSIIGTFLTQTQKNKPFESSLKSIQNSKGYRKLGQSLITQPENQIKSLTPGLKTSEFGKQIGVSPVETFSSQSQTTNPINIVKKSKNTLKSSISDNIPSSFGKSSSLGESKQVSLNVENAQDQFLSQTQRKELASPIQTSNPTQKNTKKSILSALVLGQGRIPQPEDKQRRKPAGLETRAFEKSKGLLGNALKQSQPSKPMSTSKTSKGVLKGTESNSLMTRLLGQNQAIQSAHLIHPVKGSIHKSKNALDQVLSQSKKKETMNLFVTSKPALKGIQSKSPQHRVLEKSLITESESVISSKKSETGTSNPDKTKTLVGKVLSQSRTTVNPVSTTKESRGHLKSTQPSNLAQKQSQIKEPMLLVKSDQSRIENPKNTRDPSLSLRESSSLLKTIQPTLKISKTESQANRLLVPSVITQPENLIKPKQTGFDFSKSKDHLGKVLDLSLTTQPTLLRKPGQSSIDNSKKPLDQFLSQSQRRESSSLPKTIQPSLKSTKTDIQANRLLGQSLITQPENLIKPKKTGLDVSVPKNYLSKVLDQSRTTQTTVLRKPGRSSVNNLKNTLDQFLSQSQRRESSSLPKTIQPSLKSSKTDIQANRLLGQSLITQPENLMKPKQTGLDVGKSKNRLNKALDQSQTTQAMLRVKPGQNRIDNPKNTLDQYLRQSQRRESSSLLKTIQPTLQSSKTKSQANRKLGQSLITQPENLITPKQAGLDASKSKSRLNNIDQSRTTQPLGTIKTGKSSANSGEPSSFMNRLLGRSQITQPNNLLGSSSLRNSLTQTPSLSNFKLPQISLPKLSDRSFNVLGNILDSTVKAIPVSSPKPFLLGTSILSQPKVIERVKPAGAKIAGDSSAVSVTKVPAPYNRLGAAREANGLGDKTIIDNNTGTKLAASGSNLKENQVYSCKMVCNRQ